MAASGAPAFLLRPIGALDVKRRLFGSGLRPARSLYPARLDERQDVLLTDTPSSTGAGYSLKVDAVLGRDPLHDR